MPKRHGNLFEKMFTLDALYAAYFSARKGKRKKHAVFMFERNLGANIAKLSAELSSGNYTPRPYKVFHVNDPKSRLIFAPHFRDVVVQHAMYAVLYPIMDKTFHFESFGCRIGKGTHRAADHAQYNLRRSALGTYTLQLDIRKFFYRIDRDILISLWSKKIKDNRVLNLISMFALFPDKTGIPIGNLLSQLGALIYLNPLDYFIKRVLKVDLYSRYVDDFILFGLSLKQAIEYKNTIRTWVLHNLRLELSKWIIQPVKRGINFVGFRTWRKTRFVRKRAMFNFRRSLRNGKVTGVQSSLSHALHSATYGHYLKLMEEGSICISTQ